MRFFNRTIPKQTLSVKNLKFTNVTVVREMSKDLPKITTKILADEAFGGGRSYRPPPWLRHWLPVITWCQMSTQNQNRLPVAGPLMGNSLPDNLRDTFAFNASDVLYTFAWTYLLIHKWVTVKQHNISCPTSRLTCVSWWTHRKPLETAGFTCSYWRCRSGSIIWWLAKLKWHVKQCTRHYYR